MPLDDGRVLELLNERDRGFEAVDGLFQLNEWRDRLCVGDLLTQFLDQSLVLGRSNLQFFGLELSPRHDRQVFDKCLVFLINRVDFRVELVLGLHVNELLELGYWKVEKVF